MEQLRRKYIYLIDSLISSSSQKLVILFLLGLILIGFGVLIYKTDMFIGSDKVEVITPTTSPQNSTSEIVVEIGGSVEKAGVYKLPQNSRVEDLLVVSGGLSAVADRDWVTRNINRASKLVDGQKIYIYSQSETEIAKSNGSIKLYQPVLGSADQNLSNLTNINLASKAELEKLVGIGPVLAQKIIDGRIYSNIEELVTKKIISKSLFEKIRNDITAN